MNVASSSRISLAPTAPRNSPFWRALTADIDNTSEGLKQLPYNYHESTSTTSHLDPLPVLSWPSPGAREEDLASTSDTHELLSSQGIHPRVHLEPIYRLTSGSNVLQIKDATHVTTICSGANFCTHINIGTLSDRRIGYLSKCWRSLNPTLGFFAELSLFKSQLQELQGHIVPTIIGVFCNAGKINVAMEAPHHSFWMEASPDMPAVLKRRCVEAFEKIHSAGVCHGDVHLSDIVVGGDAKITILNFHASRALASNVAVGLRAADPADLLMEMRKVKFLLDYQDARREEYYTYAGRSPDIIETKTRGHRAYSDSPGLANQFEREIEHLPEDVYRWLPFPAAPPRRFVMPGQTKAELELNIQHFLNIVDALELQAHFSYPPTPPPPNDHGRPDTETPPAVPELDARGARYNFRSRKSSIIVPPARDRTFPPSSGIRKRKVIEMAQSGCRPVKKIRFSVAHGLCEPSEESGYRLGGVRALVASLSQGREEPRGGGDIFPNGRHLEHQVEAHLPPIFPHDFAYGTTSSKQRIIDANIQRCIELGLPHPDAITQDPDNPHWRHPDITEYIRQHNRQVVQAIDLVRRYPGKPVRVPRPKRSEGSLKRAMGAIAQWRSNPGITFERSQDQPLLGKRKQSQREDGHNPSISPTQAGKIRGSKRLRSGTTFSDTNHRNVWHSPTTQDNPKNPTLKLSGIVSKNRFGVTKTRNPRRTSTFYIRGGDHTTNTDSSLPQPPHSANTQNTSFLPRKKRSWTSLPCSLAFFRDLGIPAFMSGIEIPTQSWTEERREKRVACRVNDLGYTLMMTPPYAGLLTRCMGGFRRLLR